MTNFFSEKRGDVNQKIIVIAVIVVIALFSFVRIKAVVKCTQERTDSSIFKLLFDKDIESTCKNDIQDEDENKEDENNTGDTGGTSGEEQEIPISHLEESGMDVTCSNKTSYSIFSIPSISPPQSIGTQSITLKNKKGWDMWVRISSITVSNGLQITTDDNFYRKLANNDEITFHVGWKWNVPSQYIGEKGNAKVYFSVICNEPNADELYKPDASIPNNFKVTNVTDTSISLSWDKVSQVSEYYVYRNGSLVYKGSSPSFVDKDLLSGTSYTYKLFTSVTVGTDAYASLQQKTTGISPIPPAPTHLKVYGVARDAFHVIWDEMPNTTHYRMYIDGKEIEMTAWNDYIQTGLKPNTSYTFEVAAENLYGSSEKSSIQIQTNADTGLSNPSNFRQVDKTTNSQTVAWNTVAGATEYRLYAFGKLLYEGSGTSFTHNNIKEGTAVHYFLYAKNNITKSSGIFKSFNVLGLQKPTAPYDIKISNVTNTSMTITWTKGLGANTTTIKMNGKQIYKDTGTSVSITNLTPNTAYNFDFFSSNSKGNSEAVKNSAFTTNDTYDDISNLSATCNDESYSQTFTLPATIKIGESGVFIINATNNSNLDLSLNISKIEKTGELFEGDTPVKLEYDDSKITIKPKEKINIPIKWILPSNASNTYTKKKGGIVVTVATSC